MSSLFIPGNPRNIALQSLHQSDSLRKRAYSNQLLNHVICILMSYQVGNFLPKRWNNFINLSRRSLTQPSLKNSRLSILPYKISQLFRSNKFFKVNLLPIKRSLTQSFFTVIKTSSISKSMFFTFKFRNAESSFTKFKIILIRVISWQFYLNSYNLHHSSSSFQRVTVF